jgi:GNAT superfamily N-acetyltransferase
VVSESATKPESMVRISRHEGSRDDLRQLVEMAEDSTTQLNSYIDDGELFVSQTAQGGVVGHLQLISRDSAGEIKNLAVTPKFRRRGVDSALVHHAIDISRRCGWNELIVLTATADTGNLRFYQQLGFRFIAVEPDAFTPTSGYQTDLMIDDIPLRGRRCALPDPQGDRAVSGAKRKTSSPGTHCPPNRRHGNRGGLLP